MSSPGGSMSLPIMSAVWSGERGCGSNGTVQVKCSCKSNVVGENCDQCVDGFYGFPNCQSRFWLSIKPNYFKKQRSLSSFLLT